ASILFMCVFACAQRPASPNGAPDGAWAGDALYRGARLAFSVRFQSDGGSLHAWLDSPDFLLLGNPLDSVVFERPRVRFTTPGDHPIRFEGAVAGDSIAGSALLGAVPGVIEPGAAERIRFTLRRTVTPPPPPYATRPVSFRNGA